MHSAEHSKAQYIAIAVLFSFASLLSKWKLRDLGGTSIPHPERSRETKPIYEIQIFSEFTMFLWPLGGGGEGQWRRHQWSCHTMLKHDFREGSPELLTFLFVPQKFLLRLNTLPTALQRKCTFGRMRWKQKIPTSRCHYVRLHVHSAVVQILQQWIIDAEIWHKSGQITGCSDHLCWWGTVLQSIVFCGHFVNLLKSAQNAFSFWKKWPTSNPKQQKHCAAKIWCEN